MGVKFCPACGTARQDADAFCRNCGRSLSEDDERESTADPHGASEPATASPPPAPPPAAVAPGPPPAAVPMAPPQAPPGYVAVPTSQTWSGPAAPPAPPVVPPGSTPTTALPVQAPPAVPGAAIVGLKRPVRPLALVGAAVVLVAVFLPWVSDTPGSGNGFDVPLSLLWSLETAEGIKLGVLMLIVGGAAAALSFVPGTGPVRRILGIVTMAVAVVFCIQLFRLIDQLGGSVGDAFDTLGVAAYVTLAGGGLLAASK